MMGPDSKGRFYIGNQAQDGLVVFDPSTEKFTYSDVAGGGEMMDVSNSAVDNHGWRSGPDAYRINLDTLAVTTTIKGSRPLARYDIASDTKNNLYGAVARAHTFGTPTRRPARLLLRYSCDSPRRGRPRRRHAAGQGRQAGSIVVGRVRWQLRRNAGSTEACRPADADVGHAALLLSL